MIFNPVEIIRKKRDGHPLSSEEIHSFISAAAKKEIPDYQASAFLMAVYFSGMTPTETSILTDAMIASGERVTFPGKSSKVDKHSTGGVGDKVSLVLAPLVASLGLDVPMVSGRGLGHTGGTLDKLESIPGFNVHISTKQFVELVQKHGLAMMGQTESFVPADKLLYSLRDVTATVECVPLITASILSKKVAEGIDGLVLDIKTGSGAFMAKQKDAEILAKSLVSVGKKLGLKIRALITDMNQPLGEAVGHSLEVQECIDVMKGKGPKDLRDVTIELAAHMLVLGKKTTSISQARKMATKALEDGSALKKFSEMCIAQGAKSDPVIHPHTLAISGTHVEITSAKAGTVSAIDTRSLGMILVELGGGRKKTSDKIDYSVGYLVRKKIGDKVKKGDTLLTLFYNPAQKDIQELTARLKYAYTITNKSVKAPTLIKKVI